MRRGVIGGDVSETINAAATAIASAESRGPHDSVQKKRWGSFWSLYWCFGSNKNKRIGHAVLIPESTTTAGSDVTTSDRDHSSQQPPSITLPFVAPPSSPASFLPSEPSSAIQSPTGLLSMTSVSANMYSPGGPSSIFAIGPYAYETQLVSPPVFSSFTTEPSTPYTPPPESLHLTTPSSPEVPFAHLLGPDNPNGEPGQRYPLTQYEFQSYQLQPGSPVSHLISPCSGISGSGTSSPFLDREFTANYPFFLEFRAGNHPKLLDLEKIVRRDCGSWQESGAVTPDAVGPDSRLLNRQDSDISPLPENCNKGTVVDHRVSFEITDDEVIRCVGPKLAPEFVEKTTKVENGVEHPPEVTSNNAMSPDKTHAEQERQKTWTLTLGSTKEFNFDSVDEASIGTSNHWSFFPMMRTGVS
ncbi:hypothetical protein CASFOL_036841 [Castilleja foliolosa]|uniref:Uncharacterized protein n=1 Tax=Castilleja foliolosa TaxID=1961234 RepID=A0ABD3BQJ8_9LAMI